MDIVPKFYPGQDVTARAADAVIGGRVVGISGAAESDDKANVTHAAANGAAGSFGVAARDKAAGEDVLVFKAGILPVEVGVAALAAGERVAINPDGTVSPVGTAAATHDVGSCIRGAAVGAMALVDYHPIA